VSDLYIFVGFLYTILLMEISFLAISKNDVVRCGSVFLVMERSVHPCFYDLIRAWRSLLRKCQSIGIMVAVGSKRPIRTSRCLCFILFDDRRSFYVF
jgi:hypothetical protein